MRLFVMRYRNSHRALLAGFVEAEDLAQAEQVGRAWCAQPAAIPYDRREFVAVEPAVLADASILEVATK